jgi:lactoylglutathione lyase
MSQVILAQEPGALHGRPAGEASRVVTYVMAICYVSDMARALPFYERLGLQTVFRFPAGEGTPGFAVLAAGTSRIGIGLPDTVRSLLPDRQVGVRPGGFEIALAVPDVDTAFARLRETGAPVLAEPRLMPWGEKMGFSADPDGNLLHIYQPK